MEKELIISVFGSSRPRENDAEYKEAQALGRALAEKGFAVCTGAYGGTMEAVSRGAKEAGGKTYGVTAEFFANAKANAFVDVEIRKKTWQERLFGIIEMGDGLAVCKGGTGTLAELAVAWEMMNKSVIPAKPLVVLGGFWEPILQSVREVEAGGENRWAKKKAQMVQTAATAQKAADLLARDLLKN
jgi:uncharacterized protein (TIGR00725 family)